MTRTTYIFACDLCFGEHKKSDNDAIPVGWQRLTYDHTDGGGHTQTIERHVCDRCVQRVAKNAKLQ